MAGSRLCTVHFLFQAICYLLEIEQLEITSVEEVNEWRQVFSAYFFVSDTILSLTILPFKLQR